MDGVSAIGWFFFLFYALVHSKHAYTHQRPRTLIYLIKTFVKTGVCAAALLHTLLEYFLEICKQGNSLEQGNSLLHTRKMSARALLFFSDGRFH